MMSLTFGLFTQVSGSGPLGPLVCFSVLLGYIKDVSTLCHDDGQLSKKLSWENFSFCQITGSSLEFFFSFFLF